MPALRDTSLDLLGALMGALGDAASPRAITGAIARALAEQLPLSGLELGWSSPDATEAEVVLALIAEGAVVIDALTRPCDESAGARAMERATPLLLRSDARTDPWREREIADELGVAWYLVLPIDAGFAVLYLDAPRQARPRLDDDLLRLVAQLLGVAQARARVIKRVARACRHANQRVARLESAVEAEPAIEAEPVVEPEPAIEAEPVVEPEPAIEAPIRLDEAIRACIATALRYTNGKIYGEGGAAEILGLKPSTLQSKMLKLGMSRRPFIS